MGLGPKFARDAERVDVGVFPPDGFDPGPVQFAMVCAAERHGEFVADLEAKTARLRKAQMMGIATLPPGENLDAYALLYSELRGLLRPENIIAELRLRELTDSIRESQRFKRLGTRLIGAGYRAALEQLLQPLCGASLHKASATARDYFGDDPEMRKTAAEQVKKFGITDDQIQATALTMAAKQFDFFDRLVGNRAAARKALLKQHERQQKRAAKAKPAQARPVAEEAAGASGEKPVSLDASPPLIPAGAREAR